MAWQPKKIDLIDQETMGIISYFFVYLICLDWQENKASYFLYK